MLRIKGIIISGVDKRYGIMMPPGLFGKRGYGLSKRKDQTGMLLPVAKVIIFQISWKVPM
jgi:hypothetical protein